MSGSGTRALAFDHAGASYLLLAKSGVQGVDLSLEKDGTYWRGFGSVSYDTIAAVEAVGGDPVEERMCAIRDAVLLGDVS